MTPEIEVYIERLDYLHNEVKKAIHGMSPEELNWAPLPPRDTKTLPFVEHSVLAYPAACSPCVLATHIAGNESFSIHQVVGGVNVHRDRDTEFAARAASARELEALLDRVAQTTRSILQNLSSDDLSQTREARPGQAPASVRWTIVHTIEHLGQHLGHLSFTKQLYEARKG